MYKPSQEIINEFILAITPELWWLFLQMLATVCVTLLVYQLLRNITAYVMVRFDREISKNVNVIYDGDVCRIAYINIRHLILRKKGGKSELLIPITKVGQMIWEVQKNGDK